MTDSRLPSRWMTHPDMDALSDRAWRVFTLALMWSNENGTDGAVPRRAYRFLHPDGVTEGDIEELIAAALIVESEDGFVMPDWSTDLGQSTAASVRQARENNRERVARYRERHAVEEPSPTDSTDVTRYVTHDVTHEARTGKEVVNATISESEDVMPATIGWKSKKIPNAVCDVCLEPFASPDPDRFTVCPVQDDAHAVARVAS